MIRRFTIATALAGLVGMAGGTVYAQSSEILHANVPFDFRVGTEVLPAGRYEISYDAAESPGVLFVRSEDGRRGAVALTEDVTIAKPGKDATLVFDREGSGYVLAGVFGTTDGTGLEVVGTQATAD
jgi:hypothetical protein